MMPSFRSIQVATLVASAAAAPSPVLAQSTGDAIRIPFEQFTLSNGLQVILSPNRSVLACTVWNKPT